MAKPEHLTLTGIVLALLCDKAGPQHIAFNRHPGGFKVKATYQDGAVKSATSADIDDFEDDAEDFLGSLLTPEPETAPEAKPQHTAPEAHSPPPRSASAPQSPPAKAAHPAAATQERPSQK